MISTPREMTLRQLAESYLLMHPDLSKSARDDYETAIRQLEGFLGREPTIADFDRKLLNEFKKVKKKKRKKHKVKS